MCYSFVCHFLFAFGVYMSMFMHVCVCVCMDAYTHICGEQRLTLGALGVIKGFVGFLGEGRHTVNGKNSRFG